MSLEGSGEEALKRLDIFAGTDDGFKLAEEDLRLRGPGDYLGIRQSGLPFGGFGNPVLNVEAFKKVRTLAEDFWERPESAAFIDRWGALLGLEESPEEAIMGLD